MPLPGSRRGVGVGDSSAGFETTILPIHVILLRYQHCSLELRNCFADSERRSQRELYLAGIVDLARNLAEQS
jgi:hypothetical protein